MEAEYRIEHAREILEPCGLLGNYLLLDERGVWPAIERDLSLLVETEELRWRPARQLQHLPDAQEVKNTPALPNPFTARDLAAFMLGGAGAFVADFYGNWSDGPAPDRLSNIDPDSRARHAVNGAYAAYRLAIDKVGPWDADALARRDATHKAYWQSDNDKALLKVFDEAQAKWDAAHKKWLTAMVVELLVADALAHSTKTPKPMQRQRAQELAILEAIRQSGHDPLRLQRNEGGKSGIKAEVFAAVRRDPIFTGSTVFDKAWHRLSASGDISYIT